MFGPILYGCVEQMHGCVEQMHIISNYIYIYIYDDDGDGWIGWILDGEYACLSFFLVGFWVGPWFLDDPEWILRDFGCMLGWFLDGF